MTKKIIIKNNTSDLVDITIMCAVNKYLSDYTIKAELDIYGSTIITFNDYACYAQKLKSGTITFTFVDNVSAEQKQLTHQHEDKGE
jgi:hypothetical protein